MNFLIRFVQHHESFRKAEIEALAELTHINIEWIEYSPDVRAISPALPQIYFRFRFIHVLFGVICRRIV